MNTTKTLDEIRKEGIAEYEKSIESCNGINCDTLKHDRELLGAYAEKVWNAALDACRDSLPSEAYKNRFDATDERWASENPTILMSKENAVGYNGYREEALSAIDSLRTVGGKETV